jgi:cardiolipin synthase
MPERELVFHEGDRYFASLRKAIDEAKKTVDLETYIFDRDEVGERLLDHLARAARRGVRVRLLLDGFGCSQWSHAEAEALRERGIQTRFYHPLPWQTDRERLAWLRIRLARLNRRNHRKTCVVDSHVAYLGGMNVSARHSIEHAGSEAWRDTSVRIAGGHARGLSLAFEAAWSKPGTFRLRWRFHRRLGTLSGSIRLNVTRAQRRAGQAELVHRILSAKRRVWITNPYFVPDFSLIRALRFAAWSGVQVRVLVPRKNDVFGMRWAARAFYGALLRAGVRIHEYVPSVLHAKIVLADAWARVGSSNLNSRSLLHDLEADVVLSEPASLRSLERRFEADLDASMKVDPVAWRGRSPFSRLLERLALVFRRWI